MSDWFDDLTDVEVYGLFGLVMFVIGVAIWAYEKSLRRVWTTKRFPRFRSREKK